MSDENKLVDITKVILDKFTENELTRFESLFILEAVRSSLQEQIITETIKGMYISKNKPSPGVG